MSRASRILPWIALLAMTGAVAGPAVAQQAAKPEAAEDAPAAAQKKDSAAAERAYAAGTKAFEAGKTAEAIGSLSTALSSGGLPPQQMAKALLYRGIAYRREGKPALAISDLTTAVWLKGGLADADRTQAIENRRLAYMEAGLGDSPPPIGAAPLDAPAAPATSTAQAPKPEPGVVASAPVQSTSFWDSLFPWGSSQPAAKAAQPAAAPETTSAPPAAPAAAPPAEVAAAPPAAPAADAAGPPPPSPRPPAAQSVADLTTASLAGGLPGPPPPSIPITSGSETAAAGAPQPAAAPAPAAGSETGAPLTVAGIFNSMFGSSSSSSASTSAAVTTGATSGAGDSPWSMTTTFAAAETAPSGPVTESLPWASPQTAAAEKAAIEKPPVEKPPVEKAVVQKPAAAEKPPAEKPPVQKTAAAAIPVPTSLPPEEMPAAPAKAAEPQQEGAYSLQVAAVRSREEAEKLVASLKKYQALHNGAVSPSIDETVIGSMGTFYRVRLGPYADATEPGQLCKSLKPQGFDCLVLTQ